MREPMERRLKGIIVPSNLMVEFLREGCYQWLVEVGIPKSASHVRTYYEASRDAFVVVMEDESYPLWSDGEEVSLQDVHVYRIAEACQPMEYEGQPNG